MTSLSSLTPSRKNLTGGWVFYRRVSNAAEALRSIESSHFDAIVSDYAMPKWMASHCSGEIRARGYKTVFVMMTAKRLAHIAIDSINAGR